MRIDTRRASSELTTRINQAFSQPAGRDKFVVLLGEVGTDTRLLSVGLELFAKLLEQPRCKAAVARIVEPIPKAAQASLVSRMFPADLSALAAAGNVEAEWSRPPMLAGFKLGFASLVAKLTLSSSAAGAPAKIDAFLVRELTEPNRVAAWSKKLIALNNGASPTSERATQLVVDAVASPERSDGLVGNLMSATEAPNVAADFLVQVLSDPVISSQLVNSVCEVLDDSNVQALALQMIGELLELAPDTAKVTEVLKQIIASPTMVRVVQKLLDTTAASPAATAAAAAALDRLVADPQWRSAFAWFLDDWK